MLISVRLLITFLVFCAAGIQYMQKIDMSIGIVCMVNNTAIKLDDDLKIPFNKFDYLLRNESNNDSCLFKPKNDTAVTCLLNEITTNF